MLRSHSLPFASSILSVLLSVNSSVYPSRPYVEVSWNVMAHAHKPNFVFRRNGRVHLNRRGRQFNRLLAAEVCAFRGSVKSTGYPFHLPVFPSIPLPCVTVCHHISTGVYLIYIPSLGAVHLAPFFKCNCCRF
jgi:hypothetical protein